jgi:hypothetical protein
MTDGGRMVARRHVQQVNPGARRWQGQARGAAFQLIPARARTCRPRAFAAGCAAPPCGKNLHPLSLQAKTEPKTPAPRGRRA